MYLTLGKTYLTADGRHYTISTIDQLKNHNFAAYENYMKNHYHTDYNIIGIDNGPVCEWQNSCPRQRCSHAWDRAAQS